MTDMTLSEALALADQDCPLPVLAGKALKVLREHVSSANAAIFGLLLAEAIHNKKHRASFGNWSVGVDFSSGDSTAVLAYRDEDGKVHFLNSARDLGCFKDPKDC